MNKNEIKKYLKSYRGAKECAEMAEQEILRLNNLKTQTQAKLGGICDGMPRAPGPSDTTYSRCQESIDLYDSEIAAQERLKSEAKERMRKAKTLAGLAGTFKGRDAIFKHYCEGKDWCVVGDEMNYSPRSAKRIGYAALDRIAVRAKSWHFYGTFVAHISDESCDIM